MTRQPSISRHLFYASVATLALPSLGAAQEVSVALDQVHINATGAPPGGGINQIDLSRSRPISSISSQAIQQTAPPAADFGTLANLLPSFVSSAPNGNGFDAAKNMTLRGFPDGQFNVTLDGIPFADPDGFTHHSTSVFPASSIERVSIDRSPGSGTSLGYATIGGTLAIDSLAIPAVSGTRVYGAYGSFNTSVAGVRLNTARPTQDGQTALMVNVQHLQTDGAMSNADGRRNDLLLKAESRFAGMDLTVLYSVDDYHFNNPASVTTGQIAQFGRGFGFSDTPMLPSYYGYSATDRKADFGYARLRGGLGSGVRFTETLYTYSYVNRGLSLKGDLSASPVGSGLGVSATDIGGRLSNNRYRTVGNTFQLDHADATGTWRAGLWVEHSHQTNRRDAMDLTTGVPVNENKAAGSPFLFDYDSRLDTIQPFAEYAWKAASALTITPGLRYQRVQRSFDARVIQNALPGTNGEIQRTVNSALPSVEANYALTPRTHVFAQWAKGALVPNQSFFYTAQPAQGNQVKPETSRALQGGLTYADGGLDLTADAYLIELDNYVSTVTLNGVTQFVNNGKVRFRGLEAEGNAQLGAGFSAVFNASVMQAQFQASGVTSAAQHAGDSIPFVPAYTALAGLVYRDGPWHGSLLAKFIGAEYQGKNGPADGENFRVDPYHYANLEFGRTLENVLGLAHAEIDLRVDNLQDRSAVTDKAGPSALGPVQVNVLARRSFGVVFHCDI